LIGGGDPKKAQGYPGGLSFSEERPRAKAATQAARNYAEALIEAQRALANGVLKARRLNARLGQEFYEGFIEGLGKHAQNNPSLARGRYSNSMLVPFYTTT
jgi:hypothetical protein